MPAGIEKARAFDAGLCRTRLQFFKLGEGLLQIFLRAENSDEALHDLLQIAVNGIRALGTRIGERREEFLFGFRDLRIGDSGTGSAFGVIRGCHTCTTTKNEQIGERVSAQSVRAVETGSGLTR